MKVKYYSDKKKGITTAVLELEPEERSEVAFMVCDMPNIWMVNTKQLNLRRTYSGVVKLHDGDTWDEEYGKMLARRKAYGKYLVAKTKKIMQAIEMVKKDLNKLYKTADQWIERADEYLYKTIKLASTNE